MEVYRTMEAYIPAKDTFNCQALLDREATKCGEYLLRRYCQQNGLFGVTLENLEAMRGRITGPKTLVDKVLKGSSQTVNRN